MSEIKLSSYCEESDDGVRFGFLNEDGSVAIYPVYERVRDFSPDGLALVKRNGRWGYVDPSGNEVIRPEFEDAASFNKGIAAVKVNGKWGLVNRDGEFLRQPCFESRPDFSERNYARVLFGGKYGIINHSGEWEVSPEYDDIFMYDDSADLTKDGEEWEILMTADWISKPRRR